MLWMENSDYNLLPWWALLNKVPMTAAIRISSRVCNTEPKKHTIGAKDCPSRTLESRQLFCPMGQSQIPLCPFQLPQILASWKKHQEMKDIINTQDKLWIPARPLWVFISLPSVLRNCCLQGTFCLQGQTHKHLF